VALSTPVIRLSWQSRTLEVETPAGRLTPRAVIVTASTSVLTSGSIKSCRIYRSGQLDAATKLSLGSYDHIALELAGNPLGLHATTSSSSSRTAIVPGCCSPTSAARRSAWSMSPAVFGRELSARGEDAMIAFAVEWLTKLYGSDVKAALKRRAGDALERGALCGRGDVVGRDSGGQGARKILTEPLGSLFLAGEATHETLAGTVGGAWESGERAADAVLRRLGLVKEPAPEEAPRKRRRAKSGAPS